MSEYHFDKGTCIHKKNNLPTRMLVGKELKAESEREYSLICSLKVCNKCQQSDSLEKENCQLNRWGKKQTRT